MNRFIRRSVLPALAIAVAAGIGLLGGTLGQANASAALRSVSVNGTDSGDCSTMPCKTIGYAISQSNAGDTVQVAPGTYKESVTVTQKLTLLGTNATIDASGSNNGILIQGSSAAGSSVSGFTVEHANMEGILAQKTSNLKIENNTVQNNDLGAQATNLVGECAPQGEVPGDCGEAIHLWSVSNSTVGFNRVQDNVGGILSTDESGPTFGNTIVGNSVTGTGADCGIVLASHVLNIGSPIDPAQGGIYDNTVTGNTVQNSGPHGAGVGLFAAAPGASTYHNTVTGNTLIGNGIPGVAVHSHAPFQNVNDNVITNNVIAKNGADPDAASGGPTGISVFADIMSGASPIQSITISGNTISQEKFGIFMTGVAKKFDTSNNAFDPSVETPVSITVANAGAPAGGQAIQPPNTGDGGLFGQSSSPSAFVIFGMITMVLAIASAGAVGIRQR